MKAHLNYLFDKKRLGEQITLPYCGRVFTAGDGTVWLASNPIPLAYSSQYAALLTEAPGLVSSGILCGAPNGLFPANPNGQGIISPVAGGSIWVLFVNSNSNNVFYYTSTDSGATWTTRTVPGSSGVVWVPHWNGSQFILYGSSGTTSYTSTDGINWTARTSISLGNLNEIVYLNSLYFVLANATTTYATSPDGITWTSRTLAQSTPGGYVIGGLIGSGLVSWNAGAGLWLVIGSGATNQYQTSPNGTGSWTGRKFPNETLAAYQFNSGGYANGLRIASNATLTVIASLGGEILTSTDLINWTVRHLDSDNILFLSSPLALNWDGTRFVLVFPGLVFTSTDGVTWTRQPRSVFFINGYFVSMPSGFGIYALGYLFKISDPASSSANTIIAPSAQPDTTPRIYYRIK